MHVKNDNLRMIFIIIAMPRPFYDSVGSRGVRCGNSAYSETFSVIGDIIDIFRVFFVNFS